MKKIYLTLLTLFGFLCSGCTSNTIDYYANSKPKLDLRSYFSGDIVGWGSIFDYRGRQTRTFYVTMKGTWHNNDGVLEEWFTFDDGEKSERKWDLHFIDDTQFVGTAKDVVGKSQGQQKGNAVNMQYVLEIPYKKSSIALNMNDWMYLVQDDLILNRTTMKKFGFKVGEIVIYMKKQ